MMLPRNISLNFRLLFLACFLFFCKIGVWAAMLLNFFFKAAKAIALDGPVGGDPLYNLDPFQLLMQVYEVH